MSLLEVKDVSYTYQGKHQRVTALKQVNAAFEPGLFYAIIGSSGSGKTTLLSLLAGLDIPTEGEIIFQGTSTRELDRSRYRLQHISYIYQNFNLFNHLTVLENTAYPLFCQRENKKEALATARERLSQLGVSEAQMKRFPRELSGGEQQRAAIARALSSGSEIVLADEPSGNLDTENTRNIVEILKQLAAREKKLVIVVTHDPDVARQADIVLQMRDGTLHESNA